MPVTIYKGTLINPESPEDLIVKEHCLVAVEDGIIKGIYSEKDTLPEQYMNAEMVDFGDKLIIPAFSDLHIHAPQYAQRGTGMDCLLFDWLNRYTFPQESRFQNTDYARIIYAQVIRDFLTHGTMHVNLFSTIHYDACDLFFRMLEESGMYAFTGKINMDQNSPDFYVEDTDRSLEDTERFICEHSGSGFSGRVKNILIPRFAPTCSERLLKGLGKLAEKYDLGLHTHLVESRAEAEWSKELYPAAGPRSSPTSSSRLTLRKTFSESIMPSRSIVPNPPTTSQRASCRQKRCSSKDSASRWELTSAAAISWGPTASSNRRSSPPS